MIARAAVVVALGAAVPAAATPQRRVALVIGNSNYTYVGALTNPRNDAGLVARTLSGLGFKLVGNAAQVDLDKAKLDAAVEAFGRDIAGADVALFYYAGHGLQVHGVNWLVPISANPTRVQDLDFQMVDAGLVLRQMDGAGTRLNIMILDACRNNPFGERTLRGFGSGLADMKAPEGTIIFYATQPGNVAQDGAGADSPFSAALAATIRQPGLSVLETFNQVGLSVKRETSGEQQPWLSFSPIDGEFYFAGPRPGAPPPVSTALANSGEALRQNPPPQMDAASQAQAVAKGDYAFKAKDYGTAREFYETAAAAGNTDAKVDLGRLYAFGRGVPQDRTKAGALFEEAARQGNPRGDTGLGEIAVDPNIREQHFEKAAAAGDADAEEDLYLINCPFQDKPGNLDVALSWLQKAAEHGNAHAMFQLGVIDLFGVRIDGNWFRQRDNEMAMNWLEKAAAAGEPQADYVLAGIYGKGIYRPVDAAVAADWTRKGVDSGEPEQPLISEGLGWFDKLMR
jgi:uncharacterized caspase-like protein